MHQHPPQSPAARGHGTLQESVHQPNPAQLSPRCKVLAPSLGCRQEGIWCLAECPSRALAGLHIEDETTRVAVGLGLGTPLCRPHKCSHCITTVNDFATHGLSCRWSEGRYPRHAAVNAILHRSLSLPRNPSRLEPFGLYRWNEKCPDRCSILSWKCRKVLVWDTTCPDTFAYSQLSSAVRGAGVLATQAERLENAKYSHPVSSHYFMTFMVETSGVLGRQQRTSYMTWVNSYTGQLENPAAKRISCRESQLWSNGGMLQQSWEQQGPVWKPGKEKSPFGSDLFTGLLHALFAGCSHWYYLFGNVIINLCICSSLWCNSTNADRLVFSNYI